MEYGIALPQQQWLREHTSLLRYTYIACLVELRIMFNNNCSSSYILADSSFYSTA